jgi:hypothetical protein
LAEQRVALRRLKEISALRKALGNLESENVPNPYYEAKQALAIARAVRDTLSAERKLAIERINEAELHLRASHDAADVMRGKLVMAERQVGVLLNEMDSLGLSSTSPVDPEDHDDNNNNNGNDDGRGCAPPSCWLQSHSDDSGSDVSGLESFYDVGSSGDGG